MYKDLLHFKKGYFFLVLSGVTVFLTYWVQSVFVTDAVYYNTYSGIMTSERIKHVIQGIKSVAFVGYLILPATIIIKVLYNTFFVTTATLLESNDVYSFSGNFNVCLKAEFVFILMQIVKIIWLIAFQKVTVLTDINLIPLSALNLFDYASVPKWSIYLLQTINVWEAIYCYAGTKLFAEKYDLPLHRAALLFCLPYLTGIIILILITGFLVLQMS